MTARPKPEAAAPHDPPLSEAEIANIRALVEPQLAALKAGMLKTFDVEEVFDELEKEIFG